MFRHSIFGIAAFFSVLLALVPNLLWLVAWCVGLLGWYRSGLDVPRKSR